MSDESWSALAGLTEAWKDANDMKKGNTTASVIRSEMSTHTTQRVPRRVGQRSVESVKLREYAEGNMTPVEMVSWFLQEVDRATRADISGATGLAWATVHGALEAIEKDHHLLTWRVNDPWEYAWK